MTKGRGPQDSSAWAGCSQSRWPLLQGSTSQGPRAKRSVDTCPSLSNVLCRLSKPGPSPMALEYLIIPHRPWAPLLCPLPQAEQLALGERGPRPAPLLPSPVPGTVRGASLSCSRAPGSFLIKARKMASQSPWSLQNRPFKLCLLPGSWGTQGSCHYQSRGMDR